MNHSPGLRDGVPLGATGAALLSQNPWSVTELSLGSFLAGNKLGRGRVLKLVRVWVKIFLGTVHGFCSRIPLSR